MFIPIRLLCFVHQIRNSIKYNQKEFLKDLKCVYQAVNKEAAEYELLKLEEKWGEQYPIVICSWQNNWDKLPEYFQYTPVIRKVIYTQILLKGSTIKSVKQQETRACSRRIQLLRNRFILHTAIYGKSGVYPLPIRLQSHSN